jgi:hypothetical protein
LAKAPFFFITIRPINGTAMNLSAFMKFIAVGFSQRIKSYQNMALAKFTWLAQVL